MIQPFDTVTLMFDNKLYILDNETYDLKICKPRDDDIFVLDDAESVPQQALYDMTAREYATYCEIQQKLIDAYEEE